MAAPSLKVTVPVGVPATNEVMVVVKVTLCPKTLGFVPDKRAVVEAAAFITKL